MYQSHSMHMSTNRGYRNCIHRATAYTYTEWKKSYTAYDAILHTHNIQSEKMHFITPFYLPPRSLTYASKVICTYYTINHIRCIYQRTGG